MISKKILKIWCLPAIWFFLIFIGSVTPLKISVVHNSDKTVHFIAYLILIIAIGRAMRASFGFLNFKYMVFALIFGIGYGILLELFQIFIPGRSFELADIMSNITGSLLGAFLCIVLMKK